MSTETNMDRLYLASLDGVRKQAPPAFCVENWDREAGQLHRLSTWLEERAQDAERYAAFKRQADADWELDQDVLRQTQPGITTTRPPQFPMVEWQGTALAELDGLRRLRRAVDACLEWQSDVSLLDSLAVWLREFAAKSLAEFESRTGCPTTTTLPPVPEVTTTLAPQEEADLVGHQTTTTTLPPAE